MSTLVTRPCNVYRPKADGPVLLVCCMSCDVPLQVAEGTLPLCLVCAELVFSQGEHARQAAWDWFFVMGYRMAGRR